MSAEWEAVRDLSDRRRVAYWVLTTDPSERHAGLGAVRQVKQGEDHIVGWFRARTYTWERGEGQGAPDGAVLGYYPTKREAMRAVEVAAEHEAGKAGAACATERFFR